MRSFVGGLGGQDISQAEFDHVLEVLDKAKPGDGPLAVGGRCATYIYPEAVSSRCRISASAVALSISL
jgi:hypothetical protein